MTAREYIQLADLLAREITAGNFKAGDRLPPQRAFAYEHGIAVSTASRVYSELLRRGLVIGEVGRGTFVAGRPPGESTHSDPADFQINLGTNFPVLPDQFDLMTKCLAPLSRPENLEVALRFTPANGTRAVRELSARFLSRGGWRPDADSMLFAGNGRQAIAAAVGALVPIGGRIGVEAVTFGVIKGIATRWGITLVPLAMDEVGIRPDAISKAHREMPLSAIYLQPVLHNPLGISYSPNRREEVARLVNKLDVPVIEDAVYGFLCDDAPLAAIAPKRCVVIDSMTKRIAPGLSLGFISSPAPFRESLMASIRSGGWMPSGYAFEAAQRLIADGTANTIAGRKREEAKQRQHMAAECFAGLEIEADTRSYHLWLKLPERWRSEAFVAAAARRGIALAPSSAFTIGQGHAPNAVRIALGSTTLDRLRQALQIIAELLRSGADNFDITE